jgi:hypothetical protein
MLAKDNDPLPLSLFIVERDAIRQVYIRLKYALTPLHRVRLQTLVTAILAKPPDTLSYRFL